ncbi:MAG: DUF3488 domain-containing transglutaminase family protein [Geobacter sp.]|nr:DUF3488 domain-containing transglutaminase family protein [Geobacter sp.]
MMRLNRLLEILVLLIALIGVIPLYPHLEPLPRVILPTAAIAGLILQRKGIRPPASLFTAVSLLLFLFYALRFGRDNVVVPAANLLAIFLAVRLAGERSNRAYLQTCALALFCLAASTLFSLSPLFLVALVMLLVLIVSALVLLTFNETDPLLALSRPELATLGKVIACSGGASLLLMLFFFAILPRTQIPLWDTMPGQGRKASGLSDRVQPGSTTAIEAGRGIVFRAAMAPLDSQQLYWRAVVFNRYSAGAWVRQPPPPGEESIRPRGAPVRQAIFPEAGKLPYLPGINVTARISGVRSTTAGDLVTTSPAVTRRRTTYEAFSAPGDTLALRRPIDRPFYLRLPKDLPPRLAAAAAKIGRTGRTDQERLSLARELFRSLDLRYATRNLPTGSNSLDLFLFDRKQGYCEFFASSLALIMRGAGVPSRVVGGYYGGNYNELGGYYVITDELAHAWTEIYLEGKGWVTVDPSTWASGFAELGNERNRSLSRRLATMADTLNYYWELAVITYDLERQLQLVNRAGEQMHRLTMPKNLRRNGLVAVLAVAAISIVVLLARRRRLSPEERLLRQFVALVEPGGEMPPETGILELATRMEDPRAIRFAMLYSSAVYHDRPLGREERRELSSLLKALRKDRRRS